MRDPKENLFKIIDVHGVEHYVVTKEVLDEFVYAQEASRRKESFTNLIKKDEVLKLLCCSESTLYRRLKDRDCKIRRGAVQGTYLKSSVLDELKR